VGVGKKMKKIDFKRFLIGLTLVSITCALPTHRVFGQGSATSDGDGYMEALTASVSGSAAVQQATADDSPYLYPSRTVIGGIVLGVAFPASKDLKETFNAESGILFYGNVAYLLSRHVGLNFTYFQYDEPSRYDGDVWVGLEGINVGPFLTYPVLPSGRIEADLRPTLGIGWGHTMYNDYTGRTKDDPSVAVGLGGTLRLNISRHFGISANYDWFYGSISSVNLSSTGLTFGLYLAY
jgi:hypothetical protein